MLESYSDVEDRLRRSKVHTFKVPERENGGDAIFKGKTNKQAKTKNCTFFRTDGKHQPRSLTDFRPVKQRECLKGKRKKKRHYLKRYNN